MKELQKLKTRFQSLFSDTTLNVKVTTSQGFAEDAIIGTSEKEKADMIVMGTKGAGGLREAFIGTITASVIENINTPVMVVPEKAKFNELRKIVFATNYAINDYENIAKAIDFARQFNAEITLLHIDTGDFTHTFEFNSIQHFKEQIKKDSKYDNVTFKLMDNKNVLEGLNLYLSESKADVIAMTTMHRNFFQKLFSRSMAKKMVYHSHIPVIVFH